MNYRATLNRRFLVPIIGMLGFACILLVVSSYYSAQKASREVVTGSLLQTASDTAAILDNWVLERKIDLNSWAGDIIFRLALSTSLVSKSARRDASRRLSLVSNAYGYYESIHLVNFEGQVVASSIPDTVGTQLPSDDHFYRKAFELGYMITDAVEKNQTGEAVLMHAQTIVDNESAIGLLVATVALSSFNQQQLLPSSTGKTRRIIFVNQSGHIFSHPDRKMNFKLRLNDLFDTSHLLNTYQTGDTYSYRDDSKESKLAAVAKVKGTGWTVIADVSDQEIDAPVVAAATINLSIAILVFALIGVVVSALVRGITHQVNQMRETFADVAQGNFEKTVSPKRDDELGQLAKSFEIMRTSIKANIAELHDEIVARVKVESELNEIQDELEQRVRERTELLEAEIVERKQAEQIVRENEERLRQMLEHSPVGIGISVLDSGEVLYSNRRAGEMFGYGTGELIGNVSSQTWVDIEQRKSFVSEFIENGYVAGREARLRRANGVELWALVTWNSINYDDQSCVLFWLYDIDELKQIQQELTEARDEAQIANNAKSDFLAKMSHELRTPLNAIIGISEMLEEDAVEVGQSALIEPLNRIHHAGDHLLNLINEILDISRIEAGRLDLSVSKFKVLVLLDNALSTAGALAQRNNNKLILEADSSLSYMWSDQTRVRQILFNLLSNASKFTEDGLVTLSVSEIAKDGEEFVRFSVTDTGIGIKAEQMGQLFLEFNQANKSISQKYGGTGLGLAICNKLCNVMGGSIEVSSVYGQGSTFTVELPKNNSTLASSGASEA